MAPQLGGNWQSDLRELVKGWDSYDGAPITSEAIKCLESFSVCPVGSGGIQLEVHRDGYDIEVCIDESGAIDSCYLGIARGDK